MKDLPVTQSVSTLDTAHCRDCGAPISGNYCAHCGQETRIETPTVRQFVHELADQYVAVEGKLGRTLRVLLSQPGQLTMDYLEGRRQRYVRPLKLYLSVSVVFFGLLGIVPDYTPIIENDPAAEKEAKQALEDAQAAAEDKDDDDATKATAAPASAAPADAKPASVVAPADDKPAGAATPADAGSSSGAAAPAAEGDPGSLKQQIDAEVSAAVKNGDTRKLGKNISGAVQERVKKELRSKGGLADRAKGFASLPPKEQARLMRAKLADDAPYAMFFLLPYFALLLSWLYRKNRLRYGAHLLFSIHVHCFIFILLMLGFLPLPSFLRTAMEFGIAAYLFIALRRVYGGGWKITLWRGALLYGFYLIAIAATAVSGVMSAVLGSSS